MKVELESHIIDAIKSKIAKCTKESDEYYGKHTGWGFGFYGEWSLARCSYDDMLETGLYSESYVITDIPEYNGALWCVQQAIDDKIYIDVFENDIACDVFLLGLHHILQTTNIPETYANQLKAYYFNDNPEYVVLHAVTDFEYDNYEN